MRRDGTLAAGFRLSTEPAGTVTCADSGTSMPSRVAVDDDIVACSPDAAYAVACWNAGSLAGVLCLRDPWSHLLVRMQIDAITSVKHPPKPAPLGLELADGTRCLIRDGGAWTRLTAHPTWEGTYSCDHLVAVWAASMDDMGIDASGPTWKVHTFSVKTQAEQVLDVTTAYYVGTDVS